jgi:hypothetical protein
MMDQPDFRAEPSLSPEGDANATSRFATWAQANLDPIIDPEPAAEGYGMDRLAEVDRDRMAARVIKESELIAFWLAWHRAGGFAQLERGGWDRSTIFRKLKRFRIFYGIHPDDASFPWLGADFERNDVNQQVEAEPTWRPSFAHRSNPHVLEPEDPFDRPGLRTAQTADPE